MQEIVIARGKLLEIVRPDPNTGKVHTLLSVEVFGVIRSIISFRLTGGTKGNNLFDDYMNYGEINPKCVN